MLATEGAAPRHEHDGRHDEPEEKGPEFMRMRFQQVERELRQTDDAGAYAHEQRQEEAPRHAPEGLFPLPYEEGVEEAGVEGFDGVVVDDEITSLLSKSPEEHVAHYEENGLSRMDAIKKAAKDRGLSKSELYKILNN